jgi:DNA-binding NarL/FixJ family response regulator
MRILIADDNALVRRGLRELLSSETAWEVCGEATGGSETLVKAQEFQPDLILLDISMPGMNGLQVAKLLRQQVPEAKILIISHHDPVHLLPRVMDTGAHACVDKSRLDPDLLLTIQKMGQSSDSLPFQR